MYAVFSRVTSIDNLFLIGKYSVNVSKVNENAILEYKRVQENRFNTTYSDHVDCNSLRRSLLNTTSLKSHTVDTSRPRQYTENDILCLTGNEITNDTDVTEVLKQLNCFWSFWNSCGIKTSKFCNFST